MGGLPGTLTSLTQLHVPELEHLYEVIVSERPIGRRAVGGSSVMCSCLRGNLARLATGRDERSGTRVKGSPVSLEPGDDGLPLTRVPDRSSRPVASRARLPLRHDPPTARRPMGAWGVPILTS